MILTGDRIGPTAHYTGYVWARNGLSHPALATTEGRDPVDSPGPRCSEPGDRRSDCWPVTARSTRCVERAIEHGGVTQVIEVAAACRHGYGDRHRYVERLPLHGRARHARPRSSESDRSARVRRVRVRRAAQPGMPGRAGERRARETEGLLGYLPAGRRHLAADSTRAQGFPAGALHLRPPPRRRQTPPVQAFRVLLSAFVRGGCICTSTTRRGRTGAARGGLHHGASPPGGGRAGTERAGDAASLTSLRRQSPYLRRRQPHDLGHSVQRSRLPVGLLREPRAPGDRVAIRRPARLAPGAGRADRGGHAVRGPRLLADPRRARPGAVP